MSEPMCLSCHCCLFETCGQSCHLLADIVAVETENATLQSQLAARDAEVARLREDAFTANDLAILYRLIHQYTQDAYRELPKEHSSHATREALRDKVTRHLINARETERAALAAPTSGSTDHEDEIDRIKRDHVVDPDGDPEDPHCVMCSDASYPVWPCDAAILLRLRT